MGYAGNSNPSYVIPTVVGSDEKATADPSRGKMDDLDFFVGDDVRGKACCAISACVSARVCFVRRPSLDHELFS